jgi:excisionase family DNA binding protein
LNLPELSERATITVPEAAKVLGISRDAAYALARAGELPGVIRLGRRLIVAVPLLLQALGATTTNASKE